MLIFQVVEAELNESFGGVAPLMADIEAKLAGKPLNAISTPSRDTSLRFRVILPDHEQIVLASGERLSSGAVTILPIDRQENEKGIGPVILWDSDHLLGPTYEVRVGIPLPQFADLTSAVRAGRIPSSITIEERGLDDNKWDRKTTPFLDVSSISLSIPIQVQRTDAPPTHLEETVSRINIRVGWLVALVAVLAALSLWRLF